MPYKWGHPCHFPGCPELARPRESYCEKHANYREAIEKETRPVRFPRPTASSTRRGYGVRWRQLRLAFLREHPICVVCGRPATDVDHIVPKVEGGSDAEENLQPLCRACHLKKTARDINRRKSWRHNFMARV